MKSKAKPVERRVTDAGRWALFSRHEIPDLVDRGQTYLSRWRIVRTPFFGVFLHAIRLPDGYRLLHNHPWTFVSIVLRGGYVEERAADLGRAQLVSLADALVGLSINLPRDVRRYRAGSVHRVRLREFHSIRTLDRTPTWTLVFVGPRRRDAWGYATPDGFLHHDDYHVSLAPT